MCTSEIQKKSTFLEDIVYKNVSTYRQQSKALTDLNLIYNYHVIIHHAATYVLHVLKVFLEMFLGLVPYILSNNSHNFRATMKL